MNTHNPSTCPEPPQVPLALIHQSNNPPVQLPAAPSIQPSTNPSSAIPVPQPPVRRSASDEGGSTLNHQLLYFSDPDILHRVDRGHLTRFLEGFESDLSSEAAERLHARYLFDEWCSFCAAWFQAEAELPPALLATFLNIETLAQPENAAILEQAIANLPPEFEIKRHFHPVGQALHLWLIAQNHPEAPWPLRTAAVPGRSNPGGGDGSSPVPLGCNPTEPPAHGNTGTPAHGNIEPPPPSAPSNQQSTNPSIQSSSPSASAEPSDQSKIQNHPSAKASAAEENSKIPEVPAVDSPDQSKIQNQNSKIQEIEPPPTDFERLAALSPIEYDHARKAEAKRLGIRLATLDDQVDRCRAQQDDAEAAKVMLPVPEPWPEPITDAPALFDTVRARYPHYVYLPTAADILLALFLGHVHAFPAFHYSPRLNLISTKEECGKSTVVAVFASMATKALRVHSLKPAVVYRVAEQRQPTLCLDEIENYLPLYRELLALLNAGNSADACAPRCEGKTVRFYKAFTPVVLSGIGDLCRTLRSRSILIPMTEAPEDAGVTRFNPESLALETELARKLARWAADNLKAIAACDPPLPKGARNRLADNWRPLFQIAHSIGGHWPALAIEAFNALKTAKASNPSIQQSNNPPASSTNPTIQPPPPSIQQSNNPASPIPVPQPPVRRSASDEGGSTLNPQLLNDILQIFAESAADRLFTRDLVARLNAIPDRPWSRIQNPHAPLTERGLAARLKPIGIKPRTLRINHVQGKGYEAKTFRAFIENESS